MELANQNIKIKLEQIDIDEQIFTNGGYCDGDSQELKNRNIDADDDSQLIIMQEIICKEEPVFYDAVAAQIVPECQMKLPAQITDPPHDFVPLASSSRATESNDTMPMARIGRGNSRIYECYLCKCSNPTIHSLRSHFAQHIGDSVYKCPHCRATFKRMWYFARHVEVEHGNLGEKPKCTYCHRTFDTQTRLTIHERVHTGQQPYKCSTCQKCFNTKASIAYHKQIHTGNVTKPFQCEQCSMRFRLKHHLDSHLRTHAKRLLLETTASNDNSGQIDGRIQRLNDQRRMSDEHLIDIRSYQCYLCAFNGNKNQLKIHSKTVHVGEKLIECELCKKVFLQQHSIDLHMKTHTKNCQYECDICGQKYQRKDALKMHIQATHSQQAAFQCELCCRKFYKKFTFVTHMRTHTGFKPHRCAFCEKCFVKKSDMRRHSRTHTGERPYPCEICKITFTRNHLLTDHKRNIHSI